MSEEPRAGPTVRRLVEQAERLRERAEELHRSVEQAHAEVEEVHREADRVHREVRSLPERESRDAEPPPDGGEDEGSSP